MHDLGSIGGTFSTARAINNSGHVGGTTDSADFSPRLGHQVVVHDDQLWLIGGDDGSRKNDVWSSSDGIAWTQRAASAAFSGRERHRIVAHDNRLWLIGGYDGSDYGNDIWRSTDGIDWRLGQHARFNFR